MARFARCEVFNPNEVAIGHIFARVCRRCWLLGDDSVSGKNFDHRKGWIEAYLQQFAAAFGIDLLGFSIISNHFHLILNQKGVGHLFRHRELKFKPSSITELPKNPVPPESVTRWPESCSVAKSPLAVYFNIAFITAFVTVH